MIKNKIQGKNETYPNRWIKTLLFIWHNLDVLLSVVGALVAIILSRLLPDNNWITTIIAALFSMIAVAMLKDRKVREESNKVVGELKQMITQMVGKVIADQFFTRKTVDYEIFDNAINELVIIQETGQLVAETRRQELLKLMRKGGKIRWISVLDDNIISELMSFRNANLGTSELILSRMNNGTKMLQVLADEANTYAKNIEVRYIAYPIDVTAVFKDPYHIIQKEREAIIRLQGFRVTFDEKLDFKINSYQSNSVFELYLKQIENLWRASTKCIFLTGESGIGKSTLLRKVIETLNQDKSIQMVGFLTKDLKDQRNNRIGFETTIIETGQIGELAKKEKGTYKLNEDTMEHLIIPALESGIEAEKAVIVIDEIGPIQLNNSKFHELIKKIIDNKKLSVIGIVAKEGHSYLEEVHKNIRTSIIEVNIENRETLHESLVLEFATRRLA